MEVSITGVPNSGWFIKENPIKMDDLGVPLFQETIEWSSARTEIDIQHWLARFRNIPHRLKKL